MALKNLDNPVNGGKCQRLYVFGEINCEARLTVGLVAGTCGAGY